ncbi:hypothetical protein MMC07_008680 [Pseudocyphellaria aurata]|nr:hypothetical protein [Pseudocyphellaria aurata]
MTLVPETLVPEVVRDSKLETRVCADEEHTHIEYVTRSSAQHRAAVREEEKWRKERELGQGASGTVYLERCIQGRSEGERVRAVKKIRKIQVGNYYRELEAIALFSLPKAGYERCFVKSFGWYDDDNSIYITMEYLPQGDLHQHLSSPLPEKECQQIVFQILEGIHFMHEMGFAHRDLKPANILIVRKGPDWRVKIADFGISKQATEGLTELRTRVGTPTFTAPEVLGCFNFQLNDTSSNPYTNAVDIWSLGVTVFFMLTGEAPFKNLYRLWQYVAGRAFPLDVLHTNKVSAQGCEFVKSLLAWNSEDRPTVTDCLRHSWIRNFTETFKPQREIKNADFVPPSPDDLESPWSPLFRRENHENAKAERYDDDAQVTSFSCHGPTPFDRGRPVGRVELDGSSRIASERAWRARATHEPHTKEHGPHWRDWNRKLNMVRTSDM